ncbi:fatty acid cis/trans isomerase [uncultured Cocleimonas sp.]|uniref:fatty acid cis/trans isomerase n=1 Tax=uncultured Cocleimonas sp. TaxID=1051587 RepID=UPI0026276A91|nr:fatty acid cis/trans isomerase [uncultured Cocleimonas sp.]
MIKNTSTKICIHSLLLFGLILLLSSCKTDTETQTIPRVVAEKQTYDFQQHVKPIIEHKCISCHACYDAPCQLKMQSAEGVDRGASKIKVYDGARLENESPTRLFVDAQTTEEWRNKGFISVLEKSVSSDKTQNNSLLRNMIELGQSNPFPANKQIPDSIELGLKRKNFCPTTGEFSKYADNNPHGGMPLAVSGLSQKEANILTTWLDEGAKVTPLSIDISESEKALIQQWETWLNSDDIRTKLVARYVYEHLYLGHLYLQTDDTETDTTNQTTQFYTLERSYTPSGETVIPVKTVRPFDDPEKPFYYRLTPITETIVHKTHIIYPFDQQRLQQYKDLFLQAEWTVNKLPGYSYQEKSNPFITYQAIPAKLRYQFLLNDAEYFVRNFIRGPVCRGQIATNVIRDQFWVMFENPKYEIYTNNDEYQNSVNSYLGLPGEKTSLSDLGTEWFKYSEKRNKYLNTREKQYRKTYPEGATTQHIWDGDKTNENAFLSIFRHHDSASVTTGWLGEIPLTTWMMDYPLFERTYYELVASFDVFGNVSHQAQTRLYFDLIRNGAEVNFLRLLPPESREKIYESWYQSAAKIKTEITYHELDDKSPTAIRYKTKDTYSEVLDSLLDQYPQLTKKQDTINRCDTACRDALSKKSKTDKINLSLSQIAAIPAKKLAAIEWLPEVSFVRVELPDQQVQSYSLLRNRRHSSVSFMLGEELRYQEKLDTLTILPTLIGSYPNLMFNLKSTEIDAFVIQFANVKSEKTFNQLIEKWGVRRMSPDFWNVLHGFTENMQTEQPLESGIYDINRYGRW